MSQVDVDRSLDAYEPARVHLPPALRVEPATRRAVILAGGRGTRLAPYTSVLPKPLMPIGDRSILEIVIAQLAEHGITDVTLSVGYLSHLIRAVLDHSHSLDVEIEYVQEEEALGTAGPLRLISSLDDTFLSMNGDVLTTLDYRDFLRHHRESGNVVTVAARRRTIKIDYGVLRLSEGSGLSQVLAWEEKPEMASYVSMGIYAVEPAALAYVPEGYFDFPSLVQALLDAGEPVGAYPYDGVWFDIGRQDDYAQACETWENVSVIGNGNGKKRTDRRRTATRTR